MTTEEPNKSLDTTPDAAADKAVIDRPIVDFIHEAVAEDLRRGRFTYVRTRLPPEPNGYLHIGHIKAFLTDYNIAKDFNGELDLRFDDTNPAKEETEYVDAIQEDAHWLGIEWKRVLFSSDFFDLLYQWAIQMVKKGKAYVDDQSPQEVSKKRGTWTEPGVDSPWRDRSVEQNLDLLERMKNGEFPDGSRTLRAKIDMAHGNMNMRDPIMYRIVHAEHHRTGSQWCIYPTYDWAHGLEDSIEGITHSICTLEFEDHRPLYNWYLDQLGVYHPQQIEFARLNLNYTVMSKRKLLRLVQEKYVSGWGDPRMPTICGFRRRGYTPESIRVFADKIGVAKRDSVVDFALLEHCLREDLNKRAPRVMGVLRPLQVIIDNYPEDSMEEMEAVNNPEDPSVGMRKVPFSRELYIEQDDFREEPPKGFFRLSPGKEVRLRYAYIIKCESVVKDEKTGQVKELHCTYDPETKSGSIGADRKVKATLHWVSASHAMEAEVRLYEHLFTIPDPDDVPEGTDFTANLNPKSLEVLKFCKVEPSLAIAKPKDRYQFERLGYFCVDLDSTKEKLVFNRTVTLRDEWAKIEKKQIANK